jgi:hypothetical protein
LFFTSRPSELQLDRRQRIRELLDLSRLADEHSMTDLSDPGSAAHRQVIEILRRLARQREGSPIVRSKQTSAPGIAGGTELPLPPFRFLRHTAFHLPQGAVTVDPQRADRRSDYERKSPMRRVTIICISILLISAAASDCFGWGAVTGPRGGAAYRGPYGGAAVRGPYGGAAVRGPYGGAAARGPYGGTAYRAPGYGGGAVYRGGAVYGGGTVYRGGYGYGGVAAGAAVGAAAGVAVGAAAGAAAASSYPSCYYPPYYCYPPPYYQPPAW